MLAIRITGKQLRIARAAIGLSMDDLAYRARVNRRTLSKWENSSNAVPDAMVSHLCRVVDILESEGIRFVPDGVEEVERPTSSTTTVITSAGAVA